MSGTERTELRWRLAEEEDAGQQRLFEEPTGWHAGHGEFRGLEFLHVRAKRIINEVPAASRVPFRFTINAYRGCACHGCVYCFARPTHEYLGLNLGEDFERKIVVKINAVERTRAEVASPKWAGDLIAMGTNTDPYQRPEGKYRLTRGIVEVLSDARNPFSILTKSTLILRDLDVLVAATRRTRVHTALSVGTLDEKVWKATEPGTPHPLRRLEAVARLNECGVPAGVLLAPILPGLSDAPEQVAAVAKAARDAGAISISPVVLHLRPGVREHYMQWLERERPDLLPLYARLYPRSYAPKAYQEEVTAPARKPPSA
ncbi:MAG: radical SAM protein [Actinomycetota bacterium]|nr:radical SAM protein [Actinomycetota bacterium]